MIDGGKALRIGVRVIVLATLGLAAGAQADPHHANPAAPRAASSPVHDGILGSSVGRARASAGLGGPATPKPAALGSVNLKQHH